MPSALSISTLVKDLKNGDKVAIVPKGSFRDIPHPRYRGRVGVVVGKRGRAYVVQIELTKKTTRTLIVNERHLEKLSSPTS